MSAILPGMDEVFKMIMVDRARKIKTIIHLKDKDEDEIPIKETVEKLTEYIHDKLKDKEENSCKGQVMPLMAQALAHGLVRYLGNQNAAFILSDSLVRDSLIHMMGMSFYLLKWIQQKDIKIHTVEESISQEDVDMYDRCSRASDLAIRYAAAGGDPKEAMREMLKRGLLKQEDLVQLGAESISSEEELVKEDDTSKN